MIHSGRHHGFVTPMFGDHEAEPADRWVNRIGDEPRRRPASEQHTHRLRLVILGGYGTFGGRLAELLSEQRALSLVIAGRSLAKAQTFCAALPARAHRAVSLDRDGIGPIIRYEGFLEVGREVAY